MTIQIVFHSLSIAITSIGWDNMGKKFGVGLVDSIIRFYEFTSLRNTYKPVKQVVVSPVVHHGQSSLPSLFLIAFDRMARSTFLWGMNERGMML